MFGGTRGWDAGTGPSSRVSNYYIIRDNGPVPLSLPSLHAFSFPYINIVTTRGGYVMEIPIKQAPIKQKKKRTKTKVTLIILGILVVLGFIVFLFVNAYINKTLAKLEGTIDLPNLQEEVVVTTDESGVPHIQAENEHDLYIAQGYIQAQERMLQMELSRRQASGMLSEVVGADAVDTDKYFRTL